MFDLDKIYLGDCLDYLRNMPDKSVDLVLTDPPYGIGIDGQKECVCNNPKHNRKGFVFKGWDVRPSKDYFDEIFRVSKNQIIFGGNFFTEFLPPSKGWIVWDKGQHGLTMSDCEMAFSSFAKPTRVFVQNRCVLLADGTIHPTQKPQTLFAWIIEHYSDKGSLILDPFSGSGTTACAAYDLGRHFICIEKDAEYHAASCERLANFKRQQKLNFD